MQYITDGQGHLPDLGVRGLVTPEVDEVHPGTEVGRHTHTGHQARG